MKHIAVIMSTIEDWDARVKQLEANIAELSAIVAKLDGVGGRGKSYIAKLAKRIKRLEDSRVSTTLPDAD